MTRRFLLGRYPVSLAELIEVLVSRLAGRASAVPPAVENVVLLVRGPRVVAAAVAVGTIVLIALRWRLNVMSLPEDEARALGLATGPFRIAIVAAATLVTSASVATSGVIGWIGLVVRPFPGHSFTAWFRKHCDDALAEALRRARAAQSGGPQAGGSRMHRARNHGHPWPHVAQGSRALHQGFQPREAGALGDGETRQRNGNAEGEELACQKVPLLGRTGHAGMAGMT